MVGSEGSTKNRKGITISTRPIGRNRHMVKVNASVEFKRQLKPLVKKYKSMKSDYADFLDFIEANPYAGVSLGNGVHKVRLTITSKGKGKSGGARVITYVVEEREDDIIINLLTIYDKSEVSSLSDTFIRTLVRDVNLGNQNKN